MSWKNSIEVTITVVSQRLTVFINYKNGILYNLWKIVKSAKCIKWNINLEKMVVPLAHYCIKKFQLRLEFSNSRSSKFFLIKNFRNFWISLNLSNFIFKIKEKVIDQVTFDHLNSKLATLISFHHFMMFMMWLVCTFW